MAGTKDDGSLIAAFRMSLFVFIPFFVIFLGQGLVSPVLPLFCRSLGGGDAAVGLAVSASALGMTAFSLPSSIITSKYGVQLPMIVGLVLMGVASALSGASARVGALPGWVALIAAQLVYGCAYMVVTLSQQVWVKREVGADVRGRLLSAIGGCSRVAKLLSPWPGGVLAQQVGQRLPFFVQSGMQCAIVPITVALYNRQQERRAAVRVESGEDADEGESAAASKPAARDSLLSSTRWRTSGWGFFTAAIFSFTLMTLRGAVPIVLPLKGEQLGFSEERIGLAFTVNGLFDALFFPLSGLWADKYGRRFPCGVSIALMAIGFAALNVRPAAGGDGFWVMMLGSAITGVGNGVSSGMVMVMGCVTRASGRASARARAPADRY